MQGIEAFNSTGQRIFSTTTRTSRTLGRITVTQTMTSFVDVPVGTGKTLFWFAFAAGEVSGGVYQVAGYPARLGYNFYIEAGQGPVVIIYGER